MREKRCSKCGKILDEFDIANGLYIDKVLGYGSKYDDEKIIITLCCSCMDELIDDCEISPIISD